MLSDFFNVASQPAAPPPPGSEMAVADLRQHGLGVLDADQVVCTDRPPHSSFTQVLVLVLAQPGDGLKTKS